MGLLDKFRNKTQTPPPIPAEVGDYQVGNYGGRLFFRTQNFTIEVSNVKFTAPPSGWHEKEFGILSFTYDVFDGKEYIDSMGHDDFEVLVGSWIRSEVSQKST